MRIVAGWYAMGRQVARLWESRLWGSVCAGCGLEGVGSSPPSKILETCKVEVDVEVDMEVASELAHSLI